MTREAERKRLVELLQSKSCWYNDCETGCDKCGNVGLCDRDIEIIADHLLDNGIGIKPPIELCKRKGDYIFVIDDDEVIEVMLCLVHYNSEGEDEIVVADEWGDRQLFYKFADYGKTVFTSREDAEKALRKEDEGK